MPETGASMSRGLRIPPADPNRTLAAHLANVARVTAGCVEEWAARARRNPDCTKMRQIWLTMAESYWQDAVLEHGHRENDFSRLVIAKAARLLEQARSASAELMPPSVPIHEDPLETIE